MSNAPDNVLLRFIVDMVVPADGVPGEHRLEQMSRELSDNLHISIAEPEDNPNLRVEKNFSVHGHDATENKCRFCEYQAYDEKNGDTVVAESEQMA